MGTRVKAIRAACALLIFIGLTLPLPALAGGYGTFAECVRNSGAVIYVTNWCPVCRAQRKDFRGYANRLKYVDCSIPGSKKTRAKCKKIGIDAFPTWIFGNGTKREGKLSVADIASHSGCPVPD